MQVLQLLSQVLQIRLSLTSPYSVVRVHVASHLLVELLPQNGIGQTNTQLKVLKSRKAGEEHDVQVVDKDWQVLQLGSNVLHILLSRRSPNSLLFVQVASQSLVELLPSSGKLKC